MAYLNLKGEVKFLSQSKTMKGQITTGVIITVGGILATTILGLFGYSISANRENGVQIQEVKKDLSLKGERMSAQESTIASYEKRLERIEVKLDKLLELQGKR